MQVVLQGSLRHFPAAELLTFLCHRGRSGTLDLESGGRKTRIIFEGDTILRAESGRSEDPAEVVMEAFEWLVGSFTLLDSAVVPENAKRESLALQALLDVAKKRAEANKLYSDGTTFRLVDDPAMQQQVSLTGEEFKLLFRLSQPRAFRELATELGLAREELAGRLKKLEQLGLIIGVREEPSQAEPEPTAPQRKLTNPRKRTLVGSLTPDDRPDAVYPLLDAECSIGRSSDNTITVPDGSVSSKHARIVRSEEGFAIEDLQSRNGTYVNGERVVDAPRQLADGDLIRLGKVIMTFNVARETKASDTTLPEVRLV